MLLQSFSFNLMICFILTVIALAITIFLAIKHYKKPFNQEDKEFSYFQDSNGNHSYYERALIEKNLFKKFNPSMAHQNLRTFRRLFKCHKR